MFAIDAEHEALFQRGWPHLRILLSPHPHEKDAAKWAEKALKAYDPNVYHVEWPREVAYRFVRAMGAKRPKGPSGNIVFPDHVDANRLLQIAGPVGEKEARAIVAHVTHPQSCHKERAIEDLLFLLEAMVGPEPILDTALLRYEAMSKKELGCHNPHDIVYVAYWLGFLLMRLEDEKSRKKHAARIEKLIEKGKGTSVGERFLMVAHGAKGIEESGWRPGIHIAHYANDPAFLVKHADMGPPDMQIAYQAKDESEKVLEIFAKRQRKVEAWRLPFWVDELAVVASPTITAMLKELAAKKSVAAKVADVLANRAGKKAAKPAKKVEAKPASKKITSKKTASKKTASKKTASKKKTVAEAEKRFDELSAWLAAELKKVRGNKKKEALLLEEATHRYADIRTNIGEDPSEAVVHFFAADGCGYGKHREPAFLRVKPTDAELKRWIDAIS